jgi:uncharacterized DUF497 family protein
MDEPRRIGDSDFVWDANKAELNWKNHGVRFEDAATVFPRSSARAGRCVAQRRSARRGDWIRPARRLLFVVHIEIDGDSIRIISARTATTAEEEFYAQ